MYVIMTADQFENLVRNGSGKIGQPGVDLDDKGMSQFERDDVDAHRSIFQLFSDRLIDRKGPEKRTRLYLSEIQILMGKVGVKRKPIVAYGGMPEVQRQLLNIVIMP
jgi:hypothetical protein